MNIIYHEEPYYPQECTLLLARALADPEAYQEEQSVQHIDAFLKKMGYESPARLPMLRARLEPLRTVSEYVRTHMTTGEERLRFYFVPPAGCCLMPGLVLASIERRGSDLAELTQPERHRVMAGILHEYLDFLGSGDTALPSDDAEFFDWLERQELDVRDKWSCMRLYQRGEEYQAEWRVILGEAQRYYQERRAVWEPVLRESMAVFREKLEQGGASYLAERYHVKSAYDQIELFPSLAGFNMFSISNFEHAEGGTAGTDLLDVGYMIEELMALDSRDAVSLERLNSQMKAIGDKRRLEILTVLRQNPLCGQEIAELVGLTPATVSHHMNELVSSGFVDIVKEGARVNYLYSQPGMESFLRNIRRQFEA